MSSVLRFLLVLALVTPAAANDLRSTLFSVAGEAGVSLVIDRSVGGTVDVEGIQGPPLERLEAIAARAGLSVTRAEPADGKPVVLVRPGGGVSTGASGTGAGGPPTAPAVAAEPAPVPHRHGKHATHVASAGHLGHHAAPPPPPPPVQIDAMVVAAAPGTIAELAAFGREITPLCRGSEGTEFLDGPGPGLKVLAFDRVEPRLNEHLPWGEVGSHRDGFFTIEGRHAAVVPAGGHTQVPLECAEICAGPHGDAILKRALVIAVEPLGGGRVRLHVGLKRGMAFPGDVDPSMVAGGALESVTELALGQEVLVTGIGRAVHPALVVAHEPACDPLERFMHRRPRGHREACAPCPPELVVRVLVRAAATSCAP